MRFRDLVAQARTCRRFKEAEPMSMADLEALVDMARLTASGGNLQPLRYVLSVDPTTNGTIFQTLAWAAYLKDWPGPTEGERPTGYVVLLLDTSVTEKLDCDHGIAAQTMLLGATDMGFAGCILASISRGTLVKALDIDPRYRVLLVLALGRPAEVRVIEPLAPGGDVRYWRDEDGTHHVPKRGLEELILAKHG